MGQEFVLDKAVSIERYFEEISRIPRDSDNEKAISDYIVTFAKERNLWVKQDELWNVVIKKNASPGYEGFPPVILQAHLDMVCVKTVDSLHDFEKDPIKLIVENGIIRADNTSLGADDGYGIAYILSILNDDIISHPPLECVFTTQEETGHYGAHHFDTGCLNGKRMIGLDVDNEDVTYVSNFCSDRMILTKNYETIEQEGMRCIVTIDRMQSDIIHGVVHPEYGHAIKAMARLFKVLVNNKVEIKINSFNGGTADNMVPLMCQVDFLFFDKNAGLIKDFLRTEFDAISKELRGNIFEASLSVEIDEQKSIQPVLSSADSIEVINMLYILPNNLFQYDVKENDLISINNIGCVHTVNGLVSITASARSKYQSAEHQLINQWRTIAEMNGFACEIIERYGAWPYNEYSPLRKLAKDIIKEKSGTELEERICPGGLEMAIFAKKIEGLDVLALGANIDSVHTTDEGLHLDSFHSSYDTLLRILKNLNE